MSNRVPEDFTPSPRTSWCAEWLAQSTGIRRHLARTSSCGTRRRGTAARPLWHAARSIRPPLVDRESDRGSLSARDEGARPRMGQGEPVHMTTKRFVAACAAAFVVSQILEILIHGFILAPDYAPYYGKLLRPMDRGGDWRALLLPLAHLSFIIAFVWVYARAATAGSWVRSEWSSAFSDGRSGRYRSGCCGTPSNPGRTRSS